MRSYHLRSLLILLALAFALAATGSRVEFVHSWPSQPADASDAASALIAARTRAYDANVRNDAAGLAHALAVFERLAATDKTGPWPAYYAAWTAWSLGGSHVQAGNQAAAKASLETAVRYARIAVTRDAGAECQAMLANALIGLAVTDASQFQALATELAPVRKKALELGPRNPRVVMMHAGMIFNIPPDRGGDQRKGIERWLEAMALFEEEAATAPADDRVPRWGRELAYGWLAGLYLRLSPPDLAKAREAAARGHALRPDFWWLNTQILPKLQDAR
jgi:hypothetical protein